MTGTRGGTEDRDWTIWREYGLGASQTVLARRHGISQVRVSQIIAAKRAEIPDQTKEQVYDQEIQILRGLRDEMMALAAGEAVPAFDQRGNILRDERGQVVMDHSGRTAAIDRLLKINERMAKMTGVEAPTRSSVEVSVQEAAREAAAARAAEAAERLRAAE